MKIFLESMKKFRVLWIFVILIFVLSIVANSSYQSRQSLVYSQSLDKVVATVEGEDITLRDFAVYVAFQENEVEEQALIYDSEDTSKYWNTNLNGKFIRYSTRDAAIEMAIHDELFYQLSRELDLELTEDELEVLENDVEDFWFDLVEDDKQEKLGITKEDVYNSYIKIAYAQKAQMIYAAIDGVSYEDYDFGEDAYSTFLENYEYTIEEDVVDRLNFGNITLEH